MGITDYPKMTHGDIEDADITKVSAFIKDMNRYRCTGSR